MQKVVGSSPIIRFARYFFFFLVGDFCGFAGFAPVAPLAPLVPVAPLAPVGGDAPGILGVM